MQYGNCDTQHFCLFPCSDPVFGYGLYSFVSKQEWVDPYHQFVNVIANCLLLDWFSLRKYIHEMQKIYDETLPNPYITAENIYHLYPNGQKTGASPSIKICHLL